MTRPNKEDLLELMADNVNAHYTLPHFALIPDWYRRYWELHMMLKLYLESESDK